MVTADTCAGVETRHGFGEAFGLLPEPALAS